MDELTAAYGRETASLQADKATAQAEIARSLRAAIRAGRRLRGEGRL